MGAAGALFSCVMLEPSIRCQHIPSEGSSGQLMLATFHIPVAILIDGSSSVSQRLVEFFPDG